MHYRIPHTFQAACLIRALPQGIHWTTDATCVTCEACLNLLNTIKPPELDGKCQVCGHDMVKRDVPFTITEDFSVLAGVRVTPNIYKVCEPCYRDYHLNLDE